MYGTRSHAAGLEIFAKIIIVKRIVIHKTNISTNAQPGDCNPKKIIDQKVFNTSCTINTDKAIFTSLRSNPFFQARNAATPINKYKVIHTGPKIQFGGANSGFTKAAYHVGIDEKVKTEPITPAISDTKIATTNLTMFDFVISLFYPECCLY